MGSQIHAATNLFFSLFFSFSVFFSFSALLPRGSLAAGVGVLR